jgi:hypothetical protein
MRDRFQHGVLMRPETLGEHVARRKLLSDRKGPVSDILFECRADATPEILIYAVQCLSPDSLMKKFGRRTLLSAFFCHTQVIYHRIIELYNSLRERPFDRKRRPCLRASEIAKMRNPWRRSALSKSARQLETRPS